MQLSRSRLLAMSLAAAAALPRRALAGRSYREVALIDQSGTPFRLGALGAPTALAFVATRCTDVCPLIERLFFQLDRDLAAEARAAQVLLVTLDPAHDGLTVMASRARDLGAVAPRFRLATGRPDDVAVVLRAFGVSVTAGPDGIPDAHGTMTYVLDAHGRAVRALPLTSWSRRDLGAALLAAR